LLAHERISIANIEIVYEEIAPEVERDGADEQTASHGKQVASKVTLDEMPTAIHIPCAYGIV